MESKIILDTNVWVSFFNEEDGQHKEAVKIVSSYPQTVIPDFVLQETLTVLKIKSSLELALGFYDLVKNNSLVDIENIDIHNDIFYISFLNANNKNLSFIDSSLLVLNNSRRYKIITFDKDLKKLL
jgi:predicted nucleic acid-binding protein